MPKRLTARFLALAVPVAILAGGFSSAHAASSEATTPHLKRGRTPTIQRHRSKAPALATDVVAVKFRKDASTSRRSQALKAAGAGTDDTIGSSGFTRVRTPHGEAHRVAAQLAADSTVEQVLPVYTRHISSVPNDPMYVHQSYLGPLHVTEGWSVSRGTGVTIAVLDTGVNPVADLAGRVLPGFDFVNGDNNPADDNGHGTMVAGVAAAAGGNGIGMAGIAWDARILPVKVLDADGAGDDGTIAQGIYWAVDQGAKIINLSLGGYDPSILLEAAVNYATSHDVLVTAAAGNDATSDPSYPAAIPSVVAVSASGSARNLAFFSNYGDYIDVAAPGWNIVGPDNVVAGQYDVEDGTSFSSPIVAGVAALMRGANPSLTQSQVASKLADTAADAGPDGRDPYFGGGIVDAWAALGGPIVDPIVSAPPGDSHEPNDSPDHGAVLAPSGSTTGTIGVEGDQDWYAITVPTIGTLTVTVTAPAWVDDSRAVDAVLEAYNPNLLPMAEADVNGDLGSGEQLAVQTFAGEVVYVSMRNWLPAVSNGPYTLISSFAASGPAIGPPLSPSVEVRNAAPDNNASFPVGALPPLSLRFNFAVDPSSIGLVTLARADTGAAVATVPELLGLDQVVLHPSAALVPAPYLFKVGGVTVSRFTVERGTWAPFADPTAMASQLTADVLFHPADPAIASWLGSLAVTYQITPPVFANALLNSSEFNTKVAPVIRLYVAYYRQVPSYATLSSWMATFAQNPAIGQLSLAVWQAGNFQQVYAGLSNTAFIDKLFRNMMQRSLSTAELNSWVAQLDAGLSRPGAIARLAASAEYIWRSQPTVEVSAVYAGLLRRSPNLAELLGWLGAAEAGRSRVSLVTDVYRSTAYAARFGAT